MVKIMNSKSSKARPRKKREQNLLIEKLNLVLSFFEKERLGILGIFILILFLSAFRMWTEAYLLNYPYKEISMKYLFNQIHIISFFVSAFIGGVTILKLITKEKIARLANLSALGFIMVVIPPFIDVFTSSNPDPYSYVSPFNLLETMASFSGSGVFLELMIIATITSLYVFMKMVSKGIRKAVISSILNWILFFSFFILLGSPFIPDIIKGAGLLVQPLLLIRYIIISIVLLLLLLFLSSKELLKSFIKSSRLITTGHFALMTIIGIFVSNHLFSIEIYQFDLFSLFSDPVYFQLFSGNLAMILLSVLAIIFTWQATVMINHVYDADIDKIDNSKRLIPLGLLKRNQVRKIAIVYGIVSLSLGFLIGIWSFLLILSFLILAVLYSVPPIRLRDSIFSTSIIGLGSSLAFFLGFYTPAYFKKWYGPQAGEIVRVFPPLSNDSLIIGLLIFVGLSIGPLIKDYKDYQGDKNAGVKNIFTIYGLNKGVKITSLLLPLPFFCLLLLFHSLIDVLILIPAGLIAGFLFYQFKNTKLIFAVYFPVILYCLLRWFSIL